MHGPVPSPGDRRVHVTKQNRRAALRQWLTGLDPKQRRVVARMAAMSREEMAALTTAQIEALYNDDGGEA